MNEWIAYNKGFEGLYGLHKKTIHSIQKLSIKNLFAFANIKKTSR